MKPLILVAAALGALMLALSATSSTLLSPSMGVTSQIPGAASVAAIADIPHDLLQVYQEAAATCPGLSWSVLAGVGKIETDHGRSPLPGVHSGANFAGAMGPMQFLAATWNAFHLPGAADPYNPHDAIFAAAHYLCSNGAGTPAKLRGAIWAYNHADWYVNQVLTQAARYVVDATHTVQAAVNGIIHRGDPFGGACHPVETQAFGPTDFPGEPIVNGVRTHTGVDLACPGGTPVHSVTDGIAHVTSGCAVGAFSCGGGFGNNVVVETQLSLPGDKTARRYFVRYAHLVRATVANGAPVHSGDLIGAEGSTGYSTGPHLHFELDADTPSVIHAVNPAPILEVTIK